ncbi:MAG: helix-turn-helix transcriptional regulator [Chloroflexi bacterium]|nr:helix-turn-helix transcriptional regulator [Chloroflexota bacterium]
MRARREALGLSQTELGRLCGVAPSYVCQLERGHIQLPSRPIFYSLVTHLTDWEQGVVVLPEDLLVAAGYLLPEEVDAKAARWAAIKRQVARISQAMTPEELHFVVALMRELVDAVHRIIALHAGAAPDRGKDKSWHRYHTL